MVYPGLHSLTCSNDCSDQTHSQMVCPNSNIPTHLRDCHGQDRLQMAYLSYNQCHCSTSLTSITCVPV